MDSGSSVTRVLTFCDTSCVIQKARVLSDLTERSGVCRNASCVMELR